jgi:hypothetical protein
MMRIAVTVNEARVSLSAMGAQVARPVFRNLFCLCALAWLGVSCGREAPVQDSPSKPSATAVATNPATPVVSASAPAPRAEFEKVKGRWLRPDGNYVLEIKGASASGQLDAAYFNPNPIRVSKAEVKMDGSTAKVYVELRDAGYPGCTYTLTHDPQSDQLVGVYFQAAMGESFDVVFTRLK